MESKRERNKKYEEEKKYSRKSLAQEFAGKGKGLGLSCAGGGLRGSPLCPGVFSPLHLSRHLAEAAFVQCWGEELASRSRGGPAAAGTGFAPLHLPAFAGSVPQARGGSRPSARVAFPTESGRYLIFPGAQRGPWAGVSKRDRGVTVASCLACLLPPPRSVGSAGSSGPRCLRSGGDTSLEGERWLGRVQGSPASLQAAVHRNPSEVWRWFFCFFGHCEPEPVCPLPRTLPGL